MPSKSSVVDKANKIPIANNAPHLNVAVNGLYKVRAILDTGCTNTAMSTGMYELIKGDTITLTPTTTTFRGVN